MGDEQAIRARLDAEQTVREWVEYFQAIDQPYWSLHALETAARVVRDEVPALLTLLDTARALNEWACGELAAALNARDAARAEREAAQAALAECDPMYLNEYRAPRCALCGRASPELPQHDPACPWLRAKALGAPVRAPGQEEG